MTHTHTTNLPDDTAITVEYDYTPAGGDGWHEPRYDATVSIYRATDARGVEITLPENERTRIEEEALIAHEERLAGERDEAMDRRAEDARERRMIGEV